MSPIIIALDFSNKKEVVGFLSHFSNEQLFLKVGMELFYQEGPEIIHLLKEMGHQIFLDLKLHDIPNTVYRAMKGLARLGVDLVNVHAAGGVAMMEHALEGLEAGTLGGGKRAKLIAVTQLTSTSEKQMQKEQLVLSTLEQSVIHYANLARQAGLDGVVSSVKEAKTLRNEFGEDFLIITPGIRLFEDSTGDQKRIASPKQARSEGVSGIVVGRSITKKEDPYQAFLKIKDEWSGLA